MKSVIFAIFTIFVFCASASVAVPGVGSRIIGGIETPFLSAPHQVSIQLLGGSHFCSGTIANSSKILTSAQCALNAAASPSRVVAGAHDLSNTDHMQTLTVLTTVSHPRFNESAFDFDYGIIHLDGAFNFTEYVQPLNYAENGYEPIGPCKIYGWGSSDKLSELAVEIVEREECASQLGSNLTPTERIICASSPLGSGQCTGDHGGAMVCKDEIGEDVLAGISSVIWSPCAETGLPNGWANVAPAHNWFTIY